LDKRRFLFDDCKSQGYILKKENMPEGLVNFIANKKQKKLKNHSRT